MFAATYDNHNINNEFRISFVIAIKSIINGVQNNIEHTYVGFIHCIC